MNKKIITHLNLLITTLIYITYPLVLFYLIYTRDERFWRVLFAPAISFVFVRMIRHCIDPPRPYEVKEIDPIIKKETKGNSFRSRHLFSAFVIAIALYFIYKPLGILLMFAGFLLAVLRVIGGVHFPRDVIVGAIIGIVSGVLGFYI